MAVSPSPKDKDDVRNRTPRRPWQRPRLTEVGTIGTVLKAGSNKVTQPNDPGDEYGPRRY